MQTDKTLQFCFLAIESWCWNIVTKFKFHSLMWNVADDDNEAVSFTGVGTEFD